MNTTIEQHLKEYKKNLKGGWVEKNNAYEGYICEALSMSPRKSRYWDAEWQGIFIEFKKGQKHLA